MTARTLIRRWHDRSVSRANLLRDWFEGRSAFDRLSLPRGTEGVRRLIEAAPFPCLSIRNSAGVPGTAGCLATLRRTGEPVLITSYHILFARGSETGNAVTAIDPHFGSRAVSIGSTLHGKVGLALGFNPPVFVDAAAIRLEDGAAQLLGDYPPDRTAEAQIGEHVFKLGAATGRSEGVIADIAYPDQWHWEYRSASAPRQILIRSLVEERPFSGSGDSGAAIRNEQGEIVAILWGTTAGGDGIASPIGAVAAALGISFAGKAMAS